MIHSQDSLDADDVRDDLQSGEPDRVADALRRLDRAWQHRTFGATPAPLPDPSVLDVFGTVAPADVLDAYLSAVANFPDFEPPPEEQDVLRLMTDAVVLHGDGHGAYELALQVRIAQRVDDAARQVLVRAGSLAAGDDTRIRAVAAVVDALLDAYNTRPSALAVLREWRASPPSPRLLRTIIAGIDEGHRRDLDRPDS